MLRALLHWFVHDWGYWQIIPKPISQVRMCKRCGFSEVRPMPCAHEWEKWRIGGEVTKDGKEIGFTQTRACTLCNFTELNAQSLFSGVWGKP